MSDQPTTAPDLLAEASAIINGERQDQYGNPEDSFALIAWFWNAYLRTSATITHLPLTPRDVALMMVLFKLAREAHQAKRDNLVDAAGYPAIAADRLGAV